MWRKDRKRLELENNPHLTVTDSGTLVFQFVTKKDIGSYQCIVRNAAGRRESEEAVLTVTGCSFVES